MTHSPQENRQGQHPDRAISHKDEDRYGFTYIATELARAIQGIGREGSAVIGIEGAWGTGKTSLLNLLRTALDEQQEARTFVLAVIRLWWRPYCFRSPPSLPRKKNASFLQINRRSTEEKIR